MLHGMAEPVHAAVRRLGLRHRVYAPVGELVPGMAYLVRRLLENTSNESFVRHRFAEGKDLDGLLAAARASTTFPRSSRCRRGPRPTPTSRRRTRPSRSPSGGEPGPRPDGRGRRPRPAPRRPIDVPGAHRRRAGAHGRRRSTRSTRGARPARRALGVVRRRRGRRRGGRGRRASPSGGRRRRSPSAPRCCSAPRRGCVPGGPSSPPSRWSRRASRGTRPTPTCARPSTSASTTAARRCASTAEAADRVQSPPGEENRLRYRGKGVDGGDRAVELPARHPDRHGRRPPSSPATRSSSSRPSRPRRSPGDSSRRCGPPARPTGVVAVPPRPRRGRRRPARRAPRRRRSSPSPARGRSAWSIVREPRPCTGRASATSSGSSPSSAARTR